MCSANFRALSGVLSRPSAELHGWQSQPRTHRPHDFMAGQHAWSWSMLRPSFAPHAPHSGAAKPRLASRALVEVPCDHAARQARQRDERHWPSLPFGQKRSMGSHASQSAHHERLSWAASQSRQVLDFARPPRNCQDSRAIRHDAQVIAGCSRFRDAACAWDAMHRPSFPSARGRGVKATDACHSWCGRHHDWPGRFSLQAWQTSGNLPRLVPGTRICRAGLRWWHERHSTIRSAGFMAYGTPRSYQHRAFSSPSR